LGAFIGKTSTKGIFTSITPRFPKGNPQSAINDPHIRPQIADQAFSHSVIAKKAAEFRLPFNFRKA
jgi:hypothetical protein